MYLYPILFSFGFMQFKNISYMQLCVITKEEYNQFHRSNMIYWIVYPLYIVVRYIFKL
jgi:hypothetical protein